MSTRRNRGESRAAAQQRIATIKARWRAEPKLDLDDLLGTTPWAAPEIDIDDRLGTPSATEDGSRP